MSEGYHDTKDTEGDAIDIFYGHRIPFLTERRWYESLGGCMSDYDGPAKQLSESHNALMVESCFARDDLIDYKAII